MMNSLLIILTAIFIIESIFEGRYFYQIRTIFNQSGRIEPTKRVQRIVTIETQWSWISWIFLLLLFVLPDVYTAILICVITLKSTNFTTLANMLRKLMKNNKSKEEGVTSLTPSPFLCYTHFC